MKMPESQGVPLLSHLESQFRFTIMTECPRARVYVCVSVCMRSSNAQDDLAK